MMDTEIYKNYATQCMYVLYVLYDDPINTPYDFHSIGFSFRM